ncbi:MAG: hypothetical protein ACLPX7_18495 [Xanthobacteraceae bacterium]
MTMIAEPNKPSEEFVRVFAAVCRALVWHLESQDVHTALHFYLADAMSRVLGGDELFRHGELTEKGAEEYRRAIAERDEALRELEISDAFADEAH